MPQRTPERIFRGIPVSDGVRRGRAVVLDRPRDHVAKWSVDASESSRELDRLERAMILTRQQIHEVQNELSEAMGSEDAGIFDAHLAILDDPTVIDGVTRMLKEEQVNVEYAFQQVTQRFVTALEEVHDEYLKERAADVRDVANRVMNNLLGRSEAFDPSKIEEPCIVISHDLSPSVTARLDRKKVLGFATEVGSQTSHTAILARSLQIPAVVGLSRVTSEVSYGQEVLLDGFNGCLVTNPSDQTLFEYGELAKRTIDWGTRLVGLRDLPAETRDGLVVDLAANMERPDDVDSVIESGARGVALFRTEYLFINRSTLPTEDEQFEAYRRVAEALAPDPVVIRTLDIGGDKLVTHLGLPEELNPFLGWRAIRYCLQEQEVFRQQLRAVLRASHYGNVKLMYPMISGTQELDQANVIYQECRDELEAKGVPFDGEMEVGSMIEVPSAVMVADRLAERVKFFSIGTNDLIQYTLATDRLNERVAHLYQPTHPAILRLIQMTVDSGHRRPIPTCVCGEMAGDVALVPLLIGLGVDSLGVAPPLVPKIKHLIRSIRADDARKLADEALNCEDSKQIADMSRALVQAAVPEILQTIENP